MVSKQRWPKFEQNVELVLVCYTLTNAAFFTASEFIRVLYLSYVEISF